MCGIVAYLGSQNAAPELVESLRRLEYRGYDSAGIATVHEAKLEVRRAVGKLHHLQRSLSAQPLPGTIGIGHTRWATHGKPSEANAHPHVADDIALIHNGIIENYLPLKELLLAEGVSFRSETDTEIVAHLVARARRTTPDLLTAVREALSQVEGAYAVAVLNAADAREIIVAKQASPLVLGLSDEGCFAGSDIPALLPFTNAMTFLEDGDMARLSDTGFEVFDRSGAAVTRTQTRVSWSPTMAEKSGYKHFMLKEIFEQPRAIEDTLRGRLNRDSASVNLDEIGLDADCLRGRRRVVLVACGTSYHASLVARDWIENWARLPCTVEIASEFRGRKPVLFDTDLVVAVSQSGETVDTLVALKEAREQNATVLAIVNVVGSAIARASDAAFFTHAGPEIGVASTKCFTAQLANLALLALALAEVRESLPVELRRRHIEALTHVPAHMHAFLEAQQAAIAEIAKTYYEARDVLFLGRGLSYPIALEGALKLKEISYIHAEGYAAGEMKHGPIALLDATVPVVVITPADESYARTFSNLQESRARDAQIIAIGDGDDAQLKAHSDALIPLGPLDDPELSPLLTVLPLQLLAYHIADLKGTDVDQPRNLAKTVTVE